MAKQSSRPETVFVKRDGSTMSIRLSEDTIGAICRAARDLNARYFVAIDHMTLEPSWGVFDMDRAQQNNPFPGEWTTDYPLRNFAPDCLDAAVVYAVAMLGKR